MAKKVLVVGAGFAGLCSAALLAKEGCEVTVLERCGGPGGRARLWEEGGFAFDMGPSWYLMPEVFDRFFTLLGRKREDYWSLAKLSTHYKVFFGGKESVEISSDFERTVELFEGFERGGGGRLRDYVANAKYKYDVAMGDFLYREYRNVFQFLNRRLMTEGLRLNVFESLDSYVRRYFTDHRARKILEYAMVFLGASPSNAPALYSLMSYLDLAEGIRFPEGGMYAIVEGLVRLCGELGVSISCGTEVTEILTSGGAATGVRARRGAENFTLGADAVLVCADYAHAERELLGEKQRSYGEGYWDKAVVAPGMFIAYLGLKERVDGIAHHNLYFADDWDDHFDRIFKRPSWPDDACFYLSAASKTDRRAAPEGKENLFLLVPTAPGLADGDELRESFFQSTMDRVERVIGSELRSKIEVKRLFTHRDFSADYHAFKGTALGLAHTLRQTAVFRPAMRSRRVKGLYYAGQYTHPGVGVPMTFIAAEVAVPAVLEGLGR